MSNIFKHKRIAIDFDGTLVKDSKDIFEDFKLGKDLEPLPGSDETTKMLKSLGFEILIFTCRPDYHRKYMEDILNKNKISYDYILFYTKPRVDLYIDNKGFRFENWEKTRNWIVEKLENKPINQEPQTKIEKLLRKEKLKYSPFKKRGKENILDVGCGSGDVYDNIKNNNKIDALEPDDTLRMLAKNKNIYKNIYKDISEIDLEKYDFLTIFGVLEHIKDRSKFLDSFKKAKKIFITVPNSNSFHRHLGLSLGIIKDLTELSDQDHEIGHQIYFSPETFKKEINNFCKRNNFKINIIGSSSFKFSSNKDMEIFQDRFKNISEVSNKLNLTGINNFYGAELFVEVEKNE